MEQSEKTLDMIVNLCKNRGYVFPGSEIYGGLANSWDYGPLGVEFKNNVKKAWLKKFVQESPYNVGLDAAIIMNPQTWVTTGHVSSFSDPLLDCRACKARHRADKLIGEEHPEVNVDAMSFDEMDQFIAEHEDIVCPVCGKHDFTPIRKFNLMFKTAIGVTEDSSSTCYLRPETAQGIFVNFANIQRTTRRKLPFGVCQVGKAFRNEITPGNFTFRTREFEQMECEFFCKPGTDLYWNQNLARCNQSIISVLGKCWRTVYEIVGGIGTALFYSDCDLTADNGKNLTLCSIVLFFFMLNISKFGMS